MGIALLVVASLVGLLASPASAATGTLSGTVSDSSAAPIGGATVDVFEATWGIPAGSTTTQPDGTYSLAVAPGTYRVRFTHPAHAETWSGTATSWVTSSAITIDDGATTVADATMADLDTIEGTVTDPDNNPVAGLTVELLYMGLAYRTTPTAADGTYHPPTSPTPPSPWASRPHRHHLGHGVLRRLQHRDRRHPRSTTTPGGTTFTPSTTPSTTAAPSASGTNGIGDTRPGVAGLYVVALDVDHLRDRRRRRHRHQRRLADRHPSTRRRHHRHHRPRRPLSATSYNSYRLVFRPERDVDTLGLANAWTTATHYPITTGTTTPTGRQPLRGHHCNPTTPPPRRQPRRLPPHQQGPARLHIAGSQLTTQRASGDYVCFRERLPAAKHRGRVCVRELLRLDLSHLSLSGDFIGANSLAGVTSRSRSFLVGGFHRGEDRADLSETPIDPAKILATDRD
ncbi:MAG: carboxypeptidase-like regulatory domain-containing protein [Acidimicrobiales bacterium]